MSDLASIGSSGPAAKEEQGSVMSLDTSNDNSVASAPSSSSTARQSLDTSNDNVNDPRTVKYKERQKLLEAWILETRQSLLNMNDNSGPAVKEKQGSVMSLDTSNDNSVASAPSSSSTARQSLDTSNDNVNDPRTVKYKERQKLLEAWIPKNTISIVRIKAKTTTTLTLTSSTARQPVTLKEDSKPPARRSRKKKAQEEADEEASSVGQCRSRRAKKAKADAEDEEPVDDKDEDEDWKPPAQRGHKKKAQGEPDEEASSIGWRKSRRAKKAKADAEEEEPVDDKAEDEDWKPPAQRGHKKKAQGEPDEEASSIGQCRSRRAKKAKADVEEEEPVDDKAEEATGSSCCL